MTNLDSYTTSTNTLFNDPNSRATTLQLTSTIVLDANWHRKKHYFQLEGCGGSNSPHIATTTGTAQVDTDMWGEALRNLGTKFSPCASYQKNESPGLRIHHNSHNIGLLSIELG